jgi:hypothetical protein
MIYGGLHPPSRLAPVRESKANNFGCLPEEEEFPLASCLGNSCRAVKHKCTETSTSQAEIDVRLVRNYEKEHPVERSGAQALHNSENREDALTVGRLPHLLDYKTWRYLVKYKLSEISSISESYNPSARTGGSTCSLPGSLFLRFPQDLPRHLVQNVQMKKSAIDPRGSNTTYNTTF